ncbi:MAG: hypothetical protein ACRDTH_28570 [Pseudonocardiaceae bacterium]
MNRVPAAAQGKPRCGNCKALLYQGEVIARQPGAAPLDALRRWRDDAITRIPSDTRSGGI